MRPCETFKTNASNITGQSAIIKLPQNNSIQRSNLLKQMTKQTQPHPKVLILKCWTVVHSTEPHPLTIQHLLLRLTKEININKNN